MDVRQHVLQMGVNLQLGKFDVPRLISVMLKHESDATEHSFYNLLEFWLVGYLIGMFFADVAGYSKIVTALVNLFQSVTRHEFIVDNSDDSFGFRVGEHHGKLHVGHLGQPKSAMSYFSSCSNQQDTDWLASSMPRLMCRSL